ncbi:alpha-amylase family glycosyl hydrolase [uncultured Acetatifactor sp.]|jgi:glycosidase|uniref:alpha-amylase family glycosyl hydrolase n=1 Tax=uncultured Acetatifactor sp. TaxID=1671927 RepID=UPI00261363D3|nr:alpha-amylase family glycosyl hydrolase [uncultured Acetatifactor sp.]
MAWYDEAIFYHIYPLGLTGAPRENSYTEPVHRLNTLIPWIAHIREIGCNAVYIGPLFESVGHGYETTDYKKLDSRLGTNEDLTNYVAECHRQGIRVILDGVFNHTGRDFFAFRDIREKRENSPYRDWYRNVNFWGNNQYNDGFSYENWGGYDLLAKLNQSNPAVRDYICDVVRFWVSEFDIDGIRLDAADVLDFDYMKALRRVADEVKPEFWLMGEVIHGDYTRWVNEGTLHSVTNYHLHKALYSGHNDHNYFEIAHTVKRLYGMGGNRPDGLKLYNFVDNHDVERIYTKLNNKAHFAPVHVLLYTLPGVPSVYYGSEFGIEGKKERYSDDSLRPALSLSDFGDALEKNACTGLIAALGKARQKIKALSYGDYQELLLTNRQYAFSRNCNGESVLVTVNNDDSDYVMTLPAGNAAEYVGALSGQRVSVAGGHIAVNVKANSGEIWVPENGEWTEDLPQGASDKEPGETAAQSPEQPGAGETAQDAGQKVSGGEAVKESSAANEAQQNSAGTERAVWEAGGKASGKEGVLGETAQKSSGAGENTRDGACGGKAEATEPSGAAESALAGAAGQETAHGPADGKAAAEEALKKVFEEGKIAGLQEAILAIMEKNGPITDQMRRDVRENVYHDSLIAWVKSFR